MVLTVTFASIRVCHLRTRDRSLSDVKSRPWKLVRQFFPCISSTRSLILRKAWSSSFCRSASETSKIRPFSESFAFFEPVVRLTNVLPTLYELQMISHTTRTRPLDEAAYSRTEKVEGALMEYQSFLVKGSTAFFLRPFFPLERRLFLPTAISSDKSVKSGWALCDYSRKEGRRGQTELSSNVWDSILPGRSIVLNIVGWKGCASR